MSEAQRTRSLLTFVSQDTSARCASVPPNLQRCSCELQARGVCYTENNQAYTQVTQVYPAEHNEDIDTMISFSNTQVTNAHHTTHDKVIDSIMPLSKSPSKNHTHDRQTHAQLPQHNESHENPRSGSRFKLRHGNNFITSTSWRSCSTSISASTSSRTNNVQVQGIVPAASLSKACNKSLAQSLSCEHTHLDTISLATHCTNSPVFRVPQDAILFSHADEAPSLSMSSGKRSGEGGASDYYSFTVTGHGHSTPIVSAVSGTHARASVKNSKAPHTHTLTQTHTHTHTYTPLAMGSCDDPRSMTDDVYSPTTGKNSQKSAL